MGWRLGWTTKIHKHEPIKLYDVKMKILDLDNVIHVRTFHGGVSWWERPYANDVMWDAKAVARNGKGVETDDGIIIPSCNIKNFSFEKVNEREEIPEEEILGMKDWRSLEWFAFLFMGGVCSAFLLVIAACIYSKVK